MSYDYKDSQAYFGYGQETEMSVKELYDLILAMTFNANDLEDGSVTNGKIADFAVDYAKLAHASIGEVHIQEAAINNAMIQNAAISRAKIQEAAIGTAQIDDLSVIGAKIANAAIDNAKIVDLAVDRAKIKDAAIDTAKIEDLAVTTAKIANLAVTSAQIGYAAIETAHIQDLAVDNAKIALAAIDTANIKDAAITNAKIEDLAVTNAKIANAAIDTANIKDAAITNAKIGDAQIDTAKIKDAAIDYAKIADAAIRTAHIEVGAITTALIAKGAIESAQIADAAITDAKIVELTANKIKTGTLDTGQVSISGPNGKLMIKNNRLQVFDKQTTPVERVSLGDVNNDGTIYGFRVRGADGTTVLYDHLGVYNEGITDGAITNKKIGDGAVENRHIVADTITGNKLVADAITAREIKAKSITANEMVANTITAASAIIADAAITTAKIADLAVTAAKIANATITNAQIKDATITTAKIGDAQITNAKIANATIESAKIKSLDATKINAETLSAISADLGEVTAGNITGVNITGSSFNSSFYDDTPGPGETYRNLSRNMDLNDGYLFIAEMIETGMPGGYYSTFENTAALDSIHMRIRQKEWLGGFEGHVDVHPSYISFSQLSNGIGRGLDINPFSTSMIDFGRAARFETVGTNLEFDAPNTRFVKTVDLCGTNARTSWGAWNIVAGINNGSHGAFYNRTGGAFIGLHSDGRVMIGNNEQAAYSAEFRKDTSMRVFGPLQASGGIVTENWQTLVFQNGWANYGGVFTNSAYMKDAFGFVHVKLFARNGAQDVVMATLPAGYRPDASTRVVVGAYGGSSTTPDQLGVLQVNANGQVVGLKTHSGYVYGTFSFRAV